MADDQIFDVIGRFAVSGKTGTVMVVFSDNSLGRFHLVSGMIATARYRNKEGQEAIEAAKLVTVTTANFHENSDLVRSAQLIDSITNSEIVRQQPAPVQPLAPQRPVGPVLTHVTRIGIGELLAESIGPVASLVMADLPEVIGIEAAIDQLSKEISDARTAMNFVTAARNIANR
jgi:hypothetical protein